MTERRDVEGASLRRRIAERVTPEMVAAVLATAVVVAAVVAFRTGLLPGPFAS